VSAGLKIQKYSRVGEDVVRRVGAVELDKRRNLKEAIKATKNKLHQIGGAYLDDSPNYVAWSRALAEAASAGPKALRTACREIMRHHASTNERLAILDEFYSAVLADLGPIHTVLDIACGFNPLAIRNRLAKSWNTLAGIGWG